MRVAVIGAGVIGLTTAVAVKSAFPNFQVTIFAEKFSPNTTGDGSAGLWSPYILNDTPVENILRWSGETYQWLEGLWKGGLAGDVGISLIPIYRLTQHPQGYPRPPWTQAVHGSRELTKQELLRFNKELDKNYTGGWHFITYTCEPIYLLPWLTKRFIKMGGMIVHKKISTINGLCEEGYNIVINCTGLGAKELAKDLEMIPVRGQVIRVQAPWTKHVIIEDDDDGNYIIPNIGCTVLGGTHQYDSNCTVNKADSTFIYNGCYKLLPSLKESKTIKEWVGIRPGRKIIRLESEFIRTSKGDESMIIHNYGHGGSGVTLCWGCALNVVGIIKNLKFRVLDSKL